MIELIVLKNLLENEWHKFEYPFFMQMAVSCTMYCATTAPAGLLATFQG